MAEGPVDLWDGAQVGYFERMTQRPRPAAAALIWEAWTDGREVDPVADGLVRGLLQASRLGVTSVKAIAKVLFPDRSQARERREWVESLMEPVVSKRLEVRR